MFARGHNLAPPDVVARRKGFHLMRAKRRLGGAELPLSVDLSLHVPPGSDQLAVGACEGFAHAYGIATRFAVMGTPIPLPSPIGIYTVARCVGRRPAADGSLPPLTDDGTESDLAIAGIQEYGVCSAETWGDMPPSQGTINDEPTLAKLEAASDFKLTGAYFLQTAGDAFVLDLMTALAAGYPVAMALPASGLAFQNYAGGILGALDGPIDHENYMVGYSIASAGDYASIVVTCANSWSASWGERGFYRGNRSFVDQLADACVLDVVASTGASER